MKKFVIVAMALIACFGAVSMATAKPVKKFRTNVTINADKTGQYNQYSEGFRGKVSSRPNRNFCKRRVVRVIQQGSGEIGRARTNAQGRYAVAIPGGDYAEGGRYVAKTKRKVIKRKNKARRVCKGGKSRVIRVQGS